MDNKKICRNFRNPGKAYIKMTTADLKEFFSKGYANILKNRCKSEYTISDLQRSILIVNHIAKNDDDAYIIDLLMFALGQIEDLQNSLETLETILNQKELEEKDKNGEQIC